MKSENTKTTVTSESPDGLRIESIRHDRWVPYPAAKAALQAFEDTLATTSIPGGKLRPPCLLFTAPSNQGKSAVINAFFGQHQPNPNAGGDASIAPVIHMQTPPKPLESRVLDKLLTVMCAPFKHGPSPDAKLNQVIHLLKLCLVKMIVLDEIHFALACTDRQQCNLGNLLRFLNNELRISIVVVGTAEATRFIKSQDNLVTRFRQIHLPVWTNNGDLAVFLQRFEKTLPLKKESNLGCESIRKQIFKLSSGSTGAMVSLIQRAAELAISTRKEKITEDLLKQAA